MSESDDDLPAGRLRLPFPTPQLTTDQLEIDQAAYKAEVAHGKPSEASIMRISMSAYNLMNGMSDATVTEEQAAEIRKVFQEHMRMSADMLTKLPMPQDERLQGQDTEGKVYAPYLLLMGLNMICHAMTEASKTTTTMERITLVSEFVRSWAMFAHLSALEETPGLSGLDVRYVAAAHAVVSPPFLPQVAQMAALARAKMEAGKPTVEPERDIPVEEGDGAAAVQRPRFKLRD